MTKPIFLSDHFGFKTKPVGFSCILCGEPVVMMFESLLICGCERAVVLVEPTLELDAQSWAAAMRLSMKAGTVVLYGDEG